MLEKETLSYVDCGSQDAICTTMNNYQWVPFVSIYDFHIEKNSKAYVTPQFWTYVKREDGSKDYVFYDAISCKDLFKGVTDLNFKEEL